MSQCLILVITAAGLGVGLPVSSRGGVPLYGVRFYTGFIAIPLSIFVGNLLLGVPLAALSRGVFVSSIVLLAVAIVRSSRQDGARVLLRHPVVVSSVLLLAALVAARRRAFIPAAWDEFSHWLLMPRQILEYHRLASADFPVNALASYTPGWPILLTYPSFVLGSPFHPSDLHLTGLVSSIAVFALCSDVALALVRQTSTSRARLAMWVVPAIALGAGGVGPLAERSVLIELPLRHAVLACLCVMLLRASGELSTRTTSLILGAVLAGLLLLKAQQWPVVAASVLLFLVLEWRAGSLPGKRLPSTAVLTLAPSVLLWILWDLATPWARSLNAPSNESLPLLERISEAASTAGRMAFALVSRERSAARTDHHYWGSVCDGWVTVIGLAGLVSALVSPRLRSVAISAWAMLAALLAALAWSYTFYFGAFEGPRFASMERYLSVVLLPLRTIGLICLVCPLVKLRDWLVSRNVPERLFHAALATLMGVSLLTGAADLAHAFAGRSEPPRVRQLLRAADHLANAIKDPAVRVLLIEQGGNGREWLIGRYAGIGRFSVPLGAWSFGETQTNLWMAPTSMPEIRRTAVEFDVVWIARSDDWFERAMAPLLAADCRPPIEGQFLVRMVKADAWEFQCRPADRPVDVPSTFSPGVHSAPSIEARPRGGGAAGEVNVVWSSIASGSAADWIGAYRNGETTYRDWQYASSCDRERPRDRKPSGSCEFRLRDPGLYEFRLIAGGGGALVAKSLPIVVAPILRH